MSATAAVEAASRRLRHEWELCLKQFSTWHGRPGHARRSHGRLAHAIGGFSYQGGTLDPTHSRSFNSAAGRRRHGGLALVLLLFAFVAGSARADLPPEGSSIGLWWRPSGIDGVSFVKAGQKGIEVAVLNGDLEKRIAKAGPTTWLREYAESSGRRWEATLRHYYPDSETPLPQKPFMEFATACLENSVYAATDGLAEPYVRVAARGRELSISRSAVETVRAEANRKGVSLCDVILDTPYILPESLRANFSKMTRAEFREALVAAPELDGADFMRLHRAYLALAKERGPGAEVYPSSAPILPAARDLNPPRPRVAPGQVAPPPAPVWNKGYIGAAIGAALVLLVLIASMLRT